MSSLAVQVAERRQDLDHVGDRLVGRERVVTPLVGREPRLEQLLERAAADVLHDRVAGVLVHREVVDVDDQRMLHLGEELPLGHGRLVGVQVAGVEQSLEHHPPVGDVLVGGEVDPAEPAVRQRAGDLVLAADQLARDELRREGELGTALRAEAVGASRLALPTTADR
jgi:hypothetical protein